MLISIASLSGGTGKTTIGLNLSVLLDSGVTFVRSNSILKENYQEEYNFELLFGDLGPMWQQVIAEKMQTKYYVLVELDAKADWEKEIMLKSDLVLLVMTPTVEHLRGSMETIDYLIRRNYPQERIKVVCNRYRLQKGLESDEILAVLPIPLSKWQWLPEEPLLLDAEKKGCKIIPGLPMLVYQGVESFEIWTNINAPIDTMFKAAEEASLYRP